MILDKEARKKLKKGVAKLKSAVEVTLGPCGHNVIVYNNAGTPYTTKDGISVAKKIFSKDEYENAGINIIREASLKTAELAGDGTTTTCILADYMIQNGGKNITPTYIHDMQEALKYIVEEIKMRKIDISNNYEMLAKVATISAKSEEIGNLVASAFEEAGEEGTVLFEESDTTETYLEQSEGTIIDRGYADSSFITNTAKRIAEYKTPIFILVDDRIDKLSKIEKQLNICLRDSRDVVIFAHDYSSEVLRLLAANHRRGRIRILPIKAEGVGNGKGEFIKDIAALVGADSYSEDTYFGGTCATIISTDVRTIITVADLETPAFQERVNNLKSLIENEEDSHLKSFHQKRLAKLVGKLCTIRVGGYTPADVKERYDRVEDAVCAAKSALAEGVVPGGGILFYRLADKLRFNGSTMFHPGYQLVLDAIQQPIKVLAKNSGYKVGKWHKLEGYQSIDFSSGDSTPVDAIERGILDPAKVLRVSLEHAVAVAILILNTKCIIEPNENIVQY